MTAAARQALAALRKEGLLLLSDGVLPSVVHAVTGAGVRGSWWSHPEGNAIFHAAGALGDHAEVATVKLVSGKVTFVHASLWADLLACVAPPAAWQRDGLDPREKALLAAVTKQGVLRLDQLPAALSGKLGKPAPYAKALELRLLVYAEELHTDSGAHSKQLETWEAWATRVAAPPRAADGRKAAEGRFAAIVQDWRRRFDAKPKLPWPEP